MPSSDTDEDGGFTITGPLTLLEFENKRRHIYFTFAENSFETGSPTQRRFSKIGDWRRNFSRDLLNKAKELAGDDRPINKQVYIKTFIGDTPDEWGSHDWLCDIKLADGGDWFSHIKAIKGEW